MTDIPQDPLTDRGDPPAHPVRAGMPVVSDKVKAFCRRFRGAHAIQAQILAGDLVEDVGEFRLDWGRDRPEGVADFVAGRSVKLTALSETGRRIGADPEVEYLATETIRHLRGV